MSRRKQRPLTSLGDGTTRRGAPGADAYLDERQRIEVGCTGRGSHKRIVLLAADVLGETEAVGVTGTPETFAIDLPFVHIEIAPDRYIHIPENFKEAPHITHPLKCGFCGRDMPMRQETLYRRLRVLKHRGVSFLDLSALDAIL